MPVTGRRREMREVGRLLARAAGGAGGLLTFVGAPGSGKTELAEAAAREARQRGFEVFRASPPARHPGRLVWAQLLRDSGAPDDLAAGLLSPDAGPLDLDSAARHLVSADPRLIVIDGVHHGGPDAAAMLSVVAARCAASATAVIATSGTPLGLPTELRLAGLSEADLAEAVLAETGGGLDPEAGHALWVASRGLPGVAWSLARELAGLTQKDDPIVHLALRAAPATAFLDVDVNLIRLLEIAAERAADDGTRARVLARLARELLDDATAGARRRALADEARRLARRTGDSALLAEVLDARLHALWDPAGAEDRLAAGSEIIDLARAAGDHRRERNGQFWRFVALMELGRVAEAESALAVFEREAAAAGDGEAAVMATARHAMLAVLRGRFDQATELTREVAAAAARAGMPDAEAITGTLAGSVAAERGSSADAEMGVQVGALPYLAHSLDGLAAALTARASPGDAGRASQAGRRSRAIAERLGLTLLLERLVPAAGEWTLARDGDDWVLTAGDERARLRDARGLRYLRALLAAPGRDIPALDLVAGGAGLAGAGTGPVLDAAARHAYRRRLDALAADLDAADRAGDRGAAMRIGAERQAVVDELRRAAGLGGRSRLAAPEAERARVNVTRTLRAAIERIAPAAPLAAAHLRGSIKTGAACRYEPAPGGPSRWHV